MRSTAWCGGISYTGVAQVRTTTAPVGIVQIGGTLSLAPLLRDSRLLDF